MLDACASAPPILDGGTPATFSWLVWPDAAEPVAGRGQPGADAPVRLGLGGVEGAGRRAARPLARSSRRATPAAASALLVGGAARPRPLRRRLDEVRTTPWPGPRNLAAYLAYCGASMVVLPEGLADRARRRALDGQAAEDCDSARIGSTWPCASWVGKGLSAWVEARLDGPLPGLPGPGLRRGPGARPRPRRPPGQGRRPVPRLFPAQPRGPRGDGAAGRRGDRRRAKARPNLAGVLIRLGPGPTLAGPPEAGL